MTKPNIKGGKKFKKGKKSTNTDNGNYPIATEGQLYAKVLKKAGGQYLDVLCSDDKERKAFIRGAFRKCVWLNPDDIILISCRDFSTSKDNKCDIIYKYTTSQAKNLYNSNQIKFQIKRDADDDNDDENTGISFDDDHEKQENDEFKKEPFGKFVYNPNDEPNEKPFNFDDI